MDSLNPALQGMGRSATLAINERSNALLRAGKTVYKFGLGQSPFPVPPSVVDALKAHAAEKDYLPVRGLPELCRVVAEYHARAEGITCSADHVLIGPGSKELMFILQLAYQGPLLIPSPSWVSYVPQAQILGRRAVWLDTHGKTGWKLSPEVLDAQCQTLSGPPPLLILNYPNNPTGVSYSKVELEELASVCRRHRVLVLSDEIYGELHHSAQHVSMVRCYPEGTIVSAGLSKWCGAGGWRLGTFLFPPQLTWLLDAMAVVASETFTSVSAPIQYAAVRAFEGGPDIDDYLARSRAILMSMAQTIVPMLREVGAQVNDADGGFYLFVDFSALADHLAVRGIHTSTELCERVLDEARVAFLPGSYFGRPPSELTVRMAYVNFDGTAALDAASRGPVNSTFLQTNCGDVLTAVDRLCSWLRQ